MDGQLSFDSLVLWPEEELLFELTRTEYLVSCIDYETGAPVHDALAFKCDQLRNELTRRHSFPRLSY